MPDVSPDTILSLLSIIASRSSLTEESFTPNPPNTPDEASANFSEAFKRAFEGIQPTFKHVPPRVSRLSTHATVIPSWEARIAATYPAGPPPITIRSKEASDIV